MDAHDHTVAPLAEAHQLLERAQCDLRAAWERADGGPPPPVGGAYERHVRNARADLEEALTHLDELEA